MTGYGTEYGSLYVIERPVTVEETQSTVQVVSVHDDINDDFHGDVETAQDAFDWSVGYGSENNNSSPEDIVPATPPTPSITDSSGVAIPPGYIPRDFGSPSDTAWLLLRQNLRICEENGVCPLEIENLLRNAISRQADYPEMSKTDIIGCLCPDEKCKPLPPMGASSIKVVVDCLECEDDCPICLCPMEDEMGCITSCRHIFHRSCFFKIPEDNWGNWKRCPLCRTRLSATSYDIIRDRFNVWSICNCCEHHKRRRPLKFCAGAPNVEHFGKCSDPRARVVFELLFRLRECTPTCHCSCRSEMRRLCRLNIYKYQI